MARSYVNLAPYADPDSRNYVPDDVTPSDRTGHGTAIAMIAAATPAALAIGPGSEVMVPMAVSVVGGVAVSTILTLFVVPCAYAVFSKLERHPPYEANKIN